MLSDGYIDRNGRFDLYNKNLEYVEFVADIISNITRIKCHIYKKYDKRFDTTGYRLTTNSSPYFKKMREIFYNSGGRKTLTKYIVDRLDFESLAHAWMCDGYMFHAKNNKKNKVQNFGFYCLEGFDKNELVLFTNRLSVLGIESKIVPFPRGYGYRPRISGVDLQRFIDNIYQFIVPCFLYKTTLYYKSMKYIDSNLQSAEQYIKSYTCTDDIVRHS